ncbi:MAG: hypothetical protein SAK29_43200, partial [Scytonema sp. PMC 1069.18]|nr:hypothetical protein [Scytonema sp. PMC 1069.18]
MLSLSQKKYEFLWDVIAQEKDLNQEVASSYMKELRTLQKMEREAKTEVAAAVSTVADGEIIKQDVFGNRYVQSAPLYEPEDIARVQRLHNLTGKMPTTLMAMGLEALEEKLFPTELNIDLIQLTKTGIESSAPTGELLTVDIAIEKNNPVVWVSEIEPRAGIFVDRQGDKALVLEDGGGEVVVPLSSLKRIDEDAIKASIASFATNSPEARIFQSALAVKQCAANLEVIPPQDKRASRDQLQKWHKCVHQTYAIAKEFAIWIDIDALRINQLIFAPGGRDFLADVVVEGRSS